MNAPERPAPSLPPELRVDFDQSAANIFYRWQHMSTDEVVAATPYSRVAIFDNGQSVRYADLEPKIDNYDSEETAVMVLPAAKIWGPETYITAEIIRQLTVPDGRLIVLPNNNVGQRAYLLSKAERAKVAGGDLSPISERHVRLCESLGITSLKLIVGHSFGASEGASFANTASDSINLHAHAFDEAPNTFVLGTRKKSRLHAAMTKEKSLVKPNIESIGLPAFDELTHTDKRFVFMKELVKYAIGGQYIAPNREINRVFRGDSFFDNVAGLVSGSPEATVSISNARLSLVCNIEATEAFVGSLNGYPAEATAQHILYEGYHVTGGSSPWSLGILARRALEWHYDKDKEDGPRNFH